MKSLITKQGLVARLLKTPFLSDIGTVLLNIFFAMLIGSVLLLLQGENPLVVYYYLLVEPLTRTSSIIKILGKATPLIFCGLAATISFRCNLFNVGVEGQLYVGALAAALVALFAPIQSRILLVSLCLLAAMAAAGTLSLLAGWLKVHFHVHEVISTIMLNYIVSALLSFVVINFLKAPGGNPRTTAFPTAARLPQFSAPEHLNFGFILALVATAVMFFIIYYTPQGWRIDASGKNMESTRFSGISSKRIILTVMLISGILAGLAGAERVLGAYGYLELNFSPGYGYDGMTVAIIGRNNPVGALITAIFIGFLHYGGVNINTYTNVSTEWVYVLIAIMFILVAAEKGIFNSIFHSLHKKKEVAAE